MRRGEGRRRIPLRVVVLSATPLRLGESLGVDLRGESTPAFFQVAFLLFRSLSFSQAFFSGDRPGGAPSTDEQMRDFRVLSWLKVGHFIYANGVFYMVVINLFDYN